VAAQSIHFPRERVNLIKFIWNLLAMLHVKELAESFSTQGSFLNNVVRKAAQEVSVTKSQLHSSQNQLQKSHKKVEQLLEETAVIKEQALRDKIKYEKQAQCTVEDLRGHLEKSNVSLAVSQGEIKRLRVKLSEEKTLLKSAMTTAELQSNRKDEMVQSLQSKCKKYKQENQKLIEYANSMKKKNSDIQSSLQPISELEFQATQLHNKVQSEMSNTRAAQSELLETKRTLKRVWKTKQRMEKTNKKQELHLARIRKQHAMKEYQLRADKEFLSSELQNARIELDKYSVELERSAAEKEEAQRACESLEVKNAERIANIEESHKEQLLRQQQLTRVHSSHNMEVQHAAFIAQLEKQLEAQRASDQIALKTLEKKVNTDYISKHEHHRRLNKLQALFKEKEKRLEKEKSSEILSVMQKFAKEQKMSDISSKMQLQSNIDNNKDELQRDREKLNSKMNLMSAKMELLRSERLKMTTKLSERTKDVEVVQQLLLKEKEKCSALEQSTKVSDNAAWRMKSCVENNEILLNGKIAELKASQTQCKLLQQENMSLKDKIGKNLVNFDKIINAQKLSRARQEDKETASQHLSESLSSLSKRYDTLRREKDKLLNELQILTHMSEEKEKALEGKVRDLKKRLEKAKSIGENFGNQLKESRDKLKRAYVDVDNAIKKITNLKDQVRDYRELSERLGKNNKDLGHFLEVERSRIQPSLRFQNASRSKNREKF
jgi:hypothetical protein